MPHAGEAATMPTAACRTSALATHHACRRRSPPMHAAAEAGIANPDRDGPQQTPSRSGSFSRRHVPPCFKPVAAFCHAYHATKSLSRHANRVTPRCIDEAIREYVTSPYARTRESSLLGMKRRLSRTFSRPGTRPPPGKSCCEEPKQISPQAAIAVEGVGHETAEPAAVPRK